MEDPGTIKTLEAITTLLEKHDKELDLLFKAIEVLSSLIDKRFNELNKLQGKGQYETK